ncbi:MAG TPA: nicotinate (nicotinamide) nucleotide adenylyltransferase [Solirubrobacteraceae bacterium]|nr:nicotinate (nicotinamide) nucleotide adenylyltransferase [Solirubrobacteraceae bacterium]
MSRVGILGGTFNPPHLGHLRCARQARAELGLDRVLVVVAAVPPHKAVPDDPGVGDRLAMARLLAAAEPWMEVSELEVGRPGPSYTITTLREIHERAPGDDLTLIVGGDMAAALPTWHEPQAILGLASLAVAERKGQRRADVLAALRPLDGARRVHFLDMPRLDVSSSQVRRRVAGGERIADLVPDAVADYIKERRLYA